ncbi:hypothetical protein OKW20_003957 [Ensifer sp. LBL]
MKPRRLTGCTIRLPDTATVPAHDTTQAVPWRRFTSAAFDGACIHDADEALASLIGRYSLTYGPSNDRSASPSRSLAVQSWCQ